MTAMLSGALVMIGGAVMYPFWPDSAVLGPLWSSVAVGGVGLFLLLLGVWWTASLGR